MKRRRALSEPPEARRELWERRPPTAAPTDRTGRHDRYSVDLGAAPSALGDGAPSLFERARDALLRYDIYPPRRMLSVVCSPDGRARTGTLIIQRVWVGPVAVETAVRVVEVFEWSEAQPSTGFTYVTLQGHVERGVASFFLSRHSQGATGKRLTFNIESWSASGAGLAKLIAPLSRSLQKGISYEALEHFRGIVAEHEVGSP